VPRPHVPSRPRRCPHRGALRRRALGPTGEFDAPGVQRYPKPVWVRRVGLLRRKRTFFEREARGLRRVTSYREQHRHALEQPLQPGMLVRTPFRHVIQSEALQTIKKGWGDAVDSPAGEVRQQRDGGELHVLHHVLVPEAADVVPHHASVIV